MYSVRYILTDHLHGGGSRRKTQENPDTESRSQNSAKWQAGTSGNGTKAGQAWKDLYSKNGRVHTYVLTFSPVFLIVYGVQTVQIIQVRSKVHP